MTTQGMFVNGDESFARSEALLGAEALARLAAARVLVVGVGGVGSWCAEALARTGVGRLTLVDHDVVAASVFHFHIIDIPALKKFLAEKGFSVKL